MSDLSAEPTSVSDVQGTLSQVAREAASAPAPEPTEPVAGDEPVPDEPVLEEPPEPEGGEPAPEPELEGVDPEVPEEPGSADPYEEFGGRQTIEAAHRMYQAAQTEDGVIQLFLEAGKQLGVGLDKIEALFTGATPEPEGQGGSGGDAGYDYDQDPDRPLTLREWQEHQRQQAEQQRQQAQQAQVAQARQAATDAIQEAVKDLGFTMEDKATKAILTLGNEYLEGKGIPDPKAAADAVRRGHADYLALIEQERQEYLSKKRQAGETVPKAPAGAAAPSSPPPAEPKDTAEAIRQAREKLRAKGVLG